MGQCNPRGAAALLAIFICATSISTATAQDSETPSLPDGFSLYKTPPAPEPELNPAPQIAPDVSVTAPLPFAFTSTSDPLCAEVQNIMTTIWMHQAQSAFGPLTIKRDGKPMVLGDGDFIPAYRVSDAGYVSPGAATCWLNETLIPGGIQDQQFNCNYQPVSLDATAIDTQTRNFKDRLEACIPASYMGPQTFTIGEMQLNDFEYGGFSVDLAPHIKAPGDLGTRVFISGVPGPVTE